jgi:hypothetical protein
MATTLDVIADRVRSILAAAPFEFQEAETPFSFDLQPDGGIDRCFRLVDAVTDDGRLHELRADPGAEYAVLQLTVPVDYESQL